MTGNCHCDIDMDIPRLFVIIDGTVLISASVTHFWVVILHF